MASLRKSPISSWVSNLNIQGHKFPSARRGISSWIKIQSKLASSQDTVSKNIQANLHSVESVPVEIARKIVIGKQRRTSGLIFGMMNFQPPRIMNLNSEYKAPLVWLFGSACEIFFNWSSRKNNSQKNWRKFNIVALEEEIFQTAFFVSSEMHKDLQKISLLKRQLGYISA